MLREEQPELREHSMQPLIPRRPSVLAGRAARLLVHYRPSLPLRMGQSLWQALQQLVRLVSLSHLPWLP